MRHGPGFAGISSVQLLSFVSSFSERDSLVVVAPMMFTAYQDGWSIRPWGLVCSVPESEQFLQTQDY